MATNSKPTRLSSRMLSSSTSTATGAATKVVGGVRSILGDISNKQKSSNVSSSIPGGGLTSKLFHAASSTISSKSASSSSATSNNMVISPAPQQISHAQLAHEVALSAATESMHSIPPIALDEVDLSDVSKPRYCSIYVNEIFRYFKETEGKYLAAPDYMNSQEDLNERMRAMLINWMIDVHHKFKLLPQTMYLTVNILDRFLERKVISRKKLQLAGCTAMLIASKYEEIFAPGGKDFVYISDHSFSWHELFQMEGTMLNVLSFNLTFPSSYVFLQRYVKVADSDSKTKIMANFLVESTLQEYAMLQFTPSQIAAAGLLLALRSIAAEEGGNIDEVWTSLLIKHTDFEEGDLENCMEGIRESLRGAERRNLRAVIKKYSTPEFMNVAQIEIHGTNQNN